MQVRFAIDNPNMLAEADVGDLFVLLGPDLVECVCTLRCQDSANGFTPCVHNDARLDPTVMHPVVVLGCRVGPGEPEYYPPGYVAQVSGASPIVFLAQPDQLQLAPRVDGRRCSFDTMLDRLDAARDRARHAALESIARFHRSLHITHSCPVNDPAHAAWPCAPSACLTDISADLTRPELASRL